MTPDLFSDLNLLLAQVRAWAVDSALVFARIGAFFAILPAFGERVVPARVRLFAALAMTLIVAPAVAAIARRRAQAPAHVDVLLILVFFICRRRFCFF